MIDRANIEPNHNHLNSPLFLNREIRSIDGLCANIGLVRKPRGNTIIDVSFHQINSCLEIVIKLDLPGHNDITRLNFLK